MLSNFLLQSLKEAKLKPIRQINRILNIHPLFTAHSIFEKKRESKKKLLFFIAITYLVNHGLHLTGTDKQVSIIKKRHQIVFINFFKYFEALCVASLSLD